MSATLPYREAGTDVVPAEPPLTDAARWRLLAFPLVTNLWPVLLFVSQKAFVIPALALAGAGNAAYRRDLVFAGMISFVGVLVYAGQYGNSYDQAHLIGFLLFVWAMPTINHAIRADQDRLRRFLTWLTLLNAVMGFVLLVTNIDLQGLRGLNRVVGSDGLTHRVYFESSSLACVVLLTTFRHRALQVLTLLLTAAFLILVARSVVTVMLLGLNLTFPYIRRSSPAVKLVAVAGAIAAFWILYLYLPVLRPDVDLSLRVKQFQLDLILGSMDSLWRGWGWGTFYPELATDPDQPYQVEMQLPMLMLQLGPAAVVAIFAGVLALFLNLTRQRPLGLARFAVFLLIGFNNPWLFVPSWYLTCQLLFRDDDDG
jgi:hypothetical protein